MQRGDETVMGCRHVRSSVLVKPFFPGMDADEGSEDEGDGFFGGDGQGFMASLEDAEQADNPDSDTEREARCRRSDPSFRHAASRRPPHNPPPRNPTQLRGPTSVHLQVSCRPRLGPVV